MKPLQFTYREAQESGFIGSLNEVPDQWTQGETLDELIEMLRSLYEDLQQGGIPGIIRRVAELVAA